MTKPTTYHRHTNPRVVHADPILCDLPIDHPVVVVDVREGSEDMERLLGLFEEERKSVRPFSEDVAAALTRYAAGESAEPAETYCLLDREGDWWVSNDPERGWLMADGCGSGEPRLLEYVAQYRIDPGVITFQPGQRVRNKARGWEYTVGRDGSCFDHTDNTGHSGDNLPWIFTSEHYELVDGGDDE